jgi:hypothetical protein
MATTNRVGTWLILAGGLVLIAVMAYAITLGGGGLLPRAGAGDTVEVAVFFPDTNSWRNFRQGVEICRDRAILEVQEQGTDAVVVRSRATGRTVRFAWDGSLGIREIRDSLDRRLAASEPPVAVVGSTNTALTIALAEELADNAPDGGGPVLLVPSATAVEVVPAGGPGDAAGPTSLLDLYPGRTFRFCLNNARFAELVVGFLADQRGERPAEVVLVVDSFDPFSVDLAVEFERVIAARFPGASLTRSDPRPGTGGLAGSPSPEQVELAESVWRKAADSTDRGPVWLVLTTQGSPANRLLEVLRAQAGPAGSRPGNLRVLCGDGIGRATLGAFAGALPFPVFSVASASASARRDESGDDSNGQIQAEVVSALLACLDRPGAPLAEALARLDLAPEDDHAVGRSLAFSAGEREGEDLGHVLEARPDEASLLAHEPGPGGRWTDLSWTPDGWRPIRPREAQTR